MNIGFDQGPVSTRKKRRPENALVSASPYRPARGEQSLENRHRVESGIGPARKKLFWSALRRAIEARFTDLSLRETKGFGDAERFGRELADDGPIW